MEKPNYSLLNIPEDLQNRYNIRPRARVHAILGGEAGGLLKMMNRNGQEISIKASELFNTTAILVPLKEE